MKTVRILVQEKFHNQTLQKNAANYHLLTEKEKNATVYKLNDLVIYIKSLIVEYSKQNLKIIVWFV